MRERSSSWSWERRRRVALVTNCLIGLAAIVGAALTSAGDDWHSLGVLATLAAFAIASDLLASRVAQTKGPDDRPSFYFSAGAPFVLGVVFLGAAPTLAFALVSLCVVARVERTPPRDVIANIANYGAHLVTAALLAEAAISGWNLRPDDAALVLVVMGVYLYVLVCNFAILVAYSTLADGDSLAELLRGWRVQLVVEAPIILLTGLTAHVYAAAGLAALAALVAMQLIFLLLARELQRSNERALALVAQAEQVSELSASRSQLVGQILSAEERERRRLAEALHDDAMQNLLAARQDLSTVSVDPNLERARVAVEATIDQLRDAIFDLHPAVLEHVGLAAAVEAVADRAARVGGFDVTVDIPPTAGTDCDVLVFSIARELLANVATHARASRAKVRVVDLEDVVVIEVSDDGCGFEPQRLRDALRKGHIGLASSEERVEALGGSFAIDSRPSFGTNITVAIPRGWTISEQPVAEVGT